MRMPRYDGRSAMADPGLFTAHPVSDGSTGRSADGVPSDTDARAHAVQTEIYRRMGGRGRAAVAFRLSDAVRRITCAGIRARHPEYTGEQIRLAHARLILGDTLVRAIWPDRELVDP
jgi:hypothetical protein